MISQPTEKIAPKKRRQKRSVDYLQAPASKPRVRFWTPIPPMDTGTASYFEMVLKRLLTSGLASETLEIVTECALLVPFINNFHGCAVTDWRSAQPSNGDILEIVAVANNEFHSFVLAAFGDPDVFKNAHVITIVHEPCCFMLMNTLSHQGQFGLDKRHLSRGLESQYGQRAPAFLEDFKCGLIGREFDYATIGAIDHLLASRTVITHSVHAFLKLFAETSIEPTRFPEVLIAAHPTPCMADRFGAHSPHVERSLTVGLFGRLTDAKRAGEALQGFSWYLDRVGEAEGANSQLLVVGSATDDEELEIARAILRLGLTAYVRRIRDANDQTFAELAAGCDAVISLRYPSCGESSGPLAHARAGLAVVIAGRFQAFAEEIIDFPVPIPQGAAALGIADALIRIHQGATTSDRVASTTSVPVDKLLMQRIASHLYQPIFATGIAK